MALFLFVAAYNSHTTQYPIICQIRKKAHLISAVPAEAYGDVKIRTTVSMTVFNAYTPASPFYLGDIEIESRAML